MAMPGGPYGKNPMSEMRVKKAERASRFFYFGKKEMCFFKNNLYLFIAPCLVKDETFIVAAVWTIIMQ